MPEITSEPISIDSVIQALQDMLPPKYSAASMERDHTKPHVSDLIDIAKPYTGPHFDGLGDLGLLWELALRPWCRQYAEENGFLYFPGTIVQEREGVLGSLDGFMMDSTTTTGAGAYRPIVVDTKMRFSKKEMQFKDRSQMKAYCYMLGMGCNTAILPVGRMISRPLSFSIELVTMTFTEIEIEENWRMLMSAKEQWTPKETR